MTTSPFSCHGCQYRSYFMESIASLCTICSGVDSGLVALLGPLSRSRANDGV